ncbi:hypothetical protein M514_20768 [Trichuris suis]|uniref:Uncharacterized protein n=1 Tax=Trichuris suis TaxID=68888 RepID=A0A085NBQ6_9BILA|nr:hypothetical protein M514_20768 [Trichuris suis]KHJ39864.1 hypothetical protein D918_10101 [Trichuris suis]
MGTLNSVIARRLSQRSPGPITQSGKTDSSRTGRNATWPFSTFLHGKL